VTQPSVTKSIKKLEDELGVKLFIREKQGVRLSPDGEKIFLL
jgi:DNA-binding transcriptional LysR family regulator